MKPGDRVTVKGAGAGHLIGPWQPNPRKRPGQHPIHWQVVELDTGRRFVVDPATITVQTESR